MTELRTIMSIGDVLEANAVLDAIAVARDQE